MKKKFFLTIVMFTVVLFCTTTTRGGNDYVLSQNGTSVTKDVYIDAATFNFNLSASCPLLYQSAYADITWVNHQGVTKHRWTSCNGPNNFGSDSDTKNGYVTVTIHAHTTNGATWPPAPVTAVASVSW